MKFFSFSRPAFVLIAILMILAPAHAAAQTGFERFITVQGTSLMDGDDEFRFIAFNVPTLLYDSGTQPQFFEKLHNLCGGTWCIQ